MTGLKAKTPRARNGKLDKSSAARSSRLEAIDPATGKVIGSVAITEEKEIPAIIARAERIANRLQAGTVDINEAVVNYVIAALPFGGIKQSGINRYHGKVGLRLFSNIKSMVIGDGKQDTEAYWFPHSQATLQAVTDSIR